MKTLGIHAEGKVERILGASIGSGRVKGREACETYTH